MFTLVALKIKADYCTQVTLVAAAVPRRGEAKVAWPTYF